MRSRRLAVAAAVVALAAGCTTAREPTTAPTAPTATQEARIVGTKVLSARMRDLAIASPALGRTASVRLLVPARFTAAPTRRWPVLYLLHGCCDTYDSWTREADVEKLTAGSDLLVVMPDGGRAGFYSDWASGKSGWETFHLDELRRLLERDYRAGTRRAIGGLSMGGLGALAYAARHPGMFRAAASFSGVVHTRLSASQSERYLFLLRAEGEDEVGLWGDPVRQAGVWAAHNPYDLAPKLRGTALFVSIGTGEPGPLDGPTAGPDDNEAALAPENTAFAARLRTLGIPARIDFYGPGTHTWPYWQRELHRAWPMVRQALGLR